jgi:hypothetical protein
VVLQPADQRLEDAIPGVMPLYVIRFNDRGFDLRFPLGTTRWHWQEIDGPFVAGPGESVNCAVKREWRGTHFWLTRLGLRMSRRMVGADLQIRAQPFGLSGAELTDIFNRQIGARLPQAERAIGPTQPLTPRVMPSPNSARSWPKPFRIANTLCIVVILVWMATRLIH